MRKPKNTYMTNDLRRDRIAIYAYYDGTECGEVAMILAEASLLRGIGHDKDEEILMNMAEKYALDCALGTREWNEEDVPKLLSVLRTFRKTNELPDFIAQRCDW